MASRTDDTRTDSEPRYREIQSGFWKLRLITEVRDDGVYVRFAPLHGSFRRIGPAVVDRVEATTYSPGAYGGWHWGIRVSPGGGTVYRITGDDGVEITKTDGTRVFVGSQTPEKLAGAIAEVCVESQKR